jgi:esterase/lipase superfamily enzyme
VLLLATLLPFSGCTRPPELIGVTNPEIPVESVSGITTHRVFITSTRQATEVSGAFFSSERAPDLALASVDVTVPPVHVTGDVERPSRLPPDPARHFTIVNPVVYAEDAAFSATLRRELATRPPGERKILLFVHGYNNTASDAILRLAQFVHDTGFKGVPVLFSWASAGSAPRYVYDLNSALIARVQSKNMGRILLASGAESLDVFAHSMGAFLMMEGLVDNQLSGQLGGGGYLGTIMLASPDIDIDLFRTQIGILPEAIRNNMFLLISKDDAALRVSRRIAGGVPRVGAADAAELEGLGVTVIDLSAIEDSASGSHSKFAGSPEVVRLIGAGLNSVGGFDKSATPALGELLVGVPIQIIGR